MSQNTLKVHDLNEDAEFDENGVEVFDEKALVEEEPSDNDLAEEELLSQGATQRVLDATQLYLGEIGYSPLLTAEEEVYFARRALRGDVASRRRMIESNLRLVVKIARRYGNRGLALLDLIDQNKAVTGVVTSATDNEPLIGVSVQVKETATGGITDIDGKFSVNAEQGQTLIFSYIGYQTQEIQIGASSVINVVLKEDTEMLDEVVVVGDRKSTRLNSSHHLTSRMPSSA